MSIAKSAPTYTLISRGGIYYVQFWQDGASRRISCRTKNAKQAKRFLAEFVIGQQSEPTAEAPTIGAVLDGYSEDRVPSNGNPPRIDAPATLLFTIANLKRHLDNLPGHLFSNGQARKYCEARRTEKQRGRSGPYRKRNLSNGTLHRELGVLRAAFAWAGRAGWIATIPFVERPTASAPKDRWLTHEEAEALLSACTVEYQRLFIAMGLYTAARTGAILELTWPQINWERRTLDFGPPRGNKRRPRHQPIVPALFDILVAAKAMAGTQTVIANKTQSIASLRRGFKFIAARAGMPDVTPHVLRHTAVTWMMQRGVPIAEIAGYAAMSQSMVERVYGHHAPDYMQNAVKALSVPLKVSVAPNHPSAPARGDMRIANSLQRAALARLRPSP